MKRLCLGAVLTLGVVLCSGCGEPKVPEEISVSSIVVSADAGVTAYLTDTFEQDYYSVDELREMAASEVDEYNEEHLASSVLLQDVRLTEDGGSVVVAYYFNDAEDYTEFLGTEFAYGTAESLESTISGLNQVLYDAKGENSITADEILGDKLREKHVLLVWDPVVVYAPYAVSYVSEQASVEEDGSVDLLGLSEDEFPVVIVMKK